MGNTQKFKKKHKTTFKYNNNNSDNLQIMYYLSVLINKSGLDAVPLFIIITMMMMRMRMFGI
jgi:hypothetical protein